jgi:hypothetical protein
MSRVIYDGLQLAGLLLVVAGTSAQFGWPAGMIVGGGLLIGFTLLEAILFRR